MKKEINIRKYLGMALAAVALCVGFTACSDDEDEGPGSSLLAGTTWTVVSADESYMDGVTYTFRADGTLISNPSQGDLTYVESGNSLRIVFDGGYMQGTLTVEDNMAVYRYRWHYSGSEASSEYVMTLRRDASSVGGDPSGDEPGAGDDSPSTGGDEEPGGGSDETGGDGGEPGTGEEEPTPTPELAGTVWTVVAADEEMMTGVSFAFLDEERLVSTPSLGDMLYSVEGNRLTIVYPDGAYTEGALNVTGALASYMYFWHYTDGESDGPYRMTLER